MVIWGDNITDITPLAGLTGLETLNLAYAVGGIDTNSGPVALYAVDTKLQRRYDENIFGGVIQTYYLNGQRHYTIMNSDTRPIDIVEGKLELKKP